MPLLYKPTVGYLPEERSTPSVTLLALIKLEIQKYKEDYLGSEKLTKETPHADIPRKESHHLSFKRQLEEWEDGGTFAQNTLIKDPYKTVFVARLYYSLTEELLSSLFARFGALSLVRIIRDKSGKSRGYGFVVFEHEADATLCVKELAPKGLAVDPPEGSKARKVLVDMERGRLVRSWKPRRLGGGLGGRHYTARGSTNRDASAAASGRRINLPQNPYVERPSKRAFPDSNLLPPKRLAVSNDSREESASIRDRYAKYQNRPGAVPSYQPSNNSGRSIRSIRRG